MKKQKNPVVPFYVIFALGIVFITAMSFVGMDQKNEIAKKLEEGDTEDVADAGDFDPEEFAQGQCIACHGGDLTGQGNNPSLVGLSLSADEVKAIIKDGTDAGMPGGLVPDGNLDEMVDYILSLGSEDAGAADEDADANAEEEVEEEVADEADAEEEADADADADKDAEEEAAEEK